MLIFQTLIPILYQIAGLLLTLYGCFVLSSLFLYIRRRQRHDWPIHPTAAIRQPINWPFVTVQLPIFNEPRVADRLVEAIAALDYPRDRLQIQVLDDSTDRTALRLSALVARLRRQLQLDITYHHRNDRSGYKAGALAAGFESARGEFIAIFDADFAPPPDWLRRTIPALLAHPQIGFVQTRWGHLNWGQNLITAAQGLALDGHFVVEQQARSAAGFMQNFNGSAGLWRRQAIIAAGGWSADTVTEDLDLSYRAQLAGWRGSYLNAVAAPAELPPALASYKRQQHRWAKGSAQTLRKLGVAIVHSPRPWPQRLYALLHLGGYTAHLPMLALLALTLPLALLPNRSLPLPFIGTISLALSALPLLVFGIAQHNLGQMRRLAALPALVIISLGLSPTIGRAVIEGFRRRGGVFARTPKQGQGIRKLIVPEDASWAELLPEALTLAYAIATLIIIAWRGVWALAPLPFLFSAGCGLALGYGLREQLVGLRPSLTLALPETPSPSDGPLA